MGKRKTTEQFKEEMFKVNPNIEVLGEYTGSRGKVSVRDKTCNHEWNSSTPHDLLRGHGCPECSHARKRKTDDQFKKELTIKNPNIKPLEIYKGTNIKILVRDKVCLHEWKAEPDSLLRGHGCPVCCNNPKTTEQFKKELKEINSNIEVLSEYIGANIKILVKDKVCGHTWDSSTPNRLLRGIGCPTCAINRRLIDRTGEINYNKNKEKMTIIKYINYSSIDVQFEDGTIVQNKTYGEIKNGSIINPYAISVYGIGYFGEGEYVSSINNKVTPYYRVWVSMLDRCYNEECRLVYPSYENCSVADEWHNFQNFAKWYEENYYQVNDEQMHLDKDILIKGNKIYSPETCVFVPNKINTLFCKCDSVRGDYPIGVCLHGSSYMARCRNTFLEKPVYLGLFPTPEKAFEKYKYCKEEHIKEIADFYKEQIPDKLYKALYRYEVQITD